MGFLIHLRANDGDYIAEERNGILTRRMKGVNFSEAAFAQRLCFAGNATSSLKLSRLASLASPSVSVPLHEAIAVLDLLVKEDPRMIANALNKIRRENASYEIEMQTE